jgi:hypothetical protein
MVEASFNTGRLEQTERVNVNDKRSSIPFLFEREAAKALEELVELFAADGL